MALPLIHRSRIASFDGEATKTPSFTVEEAIVSDTGELAWDPGAGKAGTVSIDAAKSQGLVGFLNANPKKTKHLSVSLETEFAALVLSSLDSKPVSRSGRMLLSAASRVTKTG